MKGGGLNTRYQANPSFKTAARIWDPIREVIIDYQL